MSLFRRSIKCFCVLLLLFPPEAMAAHRHVHRHHGGAASGAGWGVNDPRYSDVVVNPETGEIYHAKGADIRRYPASLTKMMTLYLLFEALEQQKVTLSTRMNISEYAASMPQTNLALTPGEQIPVETAIKALVVRSANDVAIVVAETLGGDVDNFGRMMTAKAHALGMRDTHFVNPNGLPNAAQYTTARDMAKLGIALKRDFPKYYSYFAVRQFSWAGVSYYTHNRVMLRYAGVDGIKTGFIGASGFNLVTSCKRGGRPLIGVVLGGSTGAWRDNRMIQLLDETYALIASRGAARGKSDPRNLPLSKNGAAGIAVDAEDAGAPDTTEAAAADTSTAAATSGTDDDEAAQSAIMTTKPVAANTAVAPAPFAKAAASAAAAPAVSPPANAPIVTPANAPIAHPATAAPASDWLIQVGAFSSNPLAASAAQQAYRLARPNLQGARVRIELAADTTYRSRLVGITQEQASKACAVLAANHAPCLVIHNDAVPVAPPSAPATHP